MTFEDMWKSLEEKDTTGKYKQAREMADLNMEQLEFAYNSGYADAKSKYERPQGEWIKDNSGNRFCSECGSPALYHEIGLIFESRFCPNCGAKMKGGAE